MAQTDRVWLCVCVDYPGARAWPTCVWPRARGIHRSSWRKVDGDLVRGISSSFGVLKPLALAACVCVCTNVAVGSFTVTFEKPSPHPSQSRSSSASTPTYGVTVRRSSLDCAPQHGGSFERFPTRLVVVAAAAALSQPRAGEGKPGLCCSAPVLHWPTPTPALLPVGTAVVIEKLAIFSRNPPLLIQQSGAIVLDFAAIIFTVPHAVSPPPLAFLPTAKVTPAKVKGISGLAGPPGDLPDHAGWRTADCSRS